MWVERFCFNHLASSNHLICLTAQEEKERREVKLFAHGRAAGKWEDPDSDPDPGVLAFYLTNSYFSDVGSVFGLSSQFTSKPTCQMSNR